MRERERERERERGELDKNFKKTTLIWEWWPNENGKLNQGEIGEEHVLTDGV